MLDMDKAQSNARYDTSIYLFVLIFISLFINSFIHVYNVVLLND